MPATWTTKEQAAFLQTELPGYVAAKREERGPRYLKGTNERWFTRWPERDIVFPDATDVPLTSEENEYLATAVTTRKKQIKSWMYWFAKKETRVSINPDATWLKDYLSKGKGGRSLQAIELYQQQNKEQVEERVKAEIKQRGAKTAGERMSIRRQVVAEMWEEEDEDVVTVLKEEAEKQKKKEKKKVSGQEKSGEKRTPKEYDAAVKALPSMLQSAVQAVADLTGWVFFVGAAGPNPSDEGHVYMETYSFGPRSPIGCDFQDSYDGYAEGFEIPFAKHAKQCFPKHVREARTLKTGGLRYVDEDEDLIPIKTLSSSVGNPTLTNGRASLEDHSRAGDAFEVNEGDHNVESNSQLAGDALNDNASRGNQDPGVFTLPSPHFAPPASPPTDQVQDGTSTQLSTPVAPPVSPPCPVLPPGVPFSPIENAQPCHSVAAAASLSNPACPPVPGVENADPILLDVVNQPLPTDYRLPGAVVDHELAMPLGERKAPRKKRSPPGTKGPRANAENKKAQPPTAAHKRAAARRGTKQVVEAKVPAVEEDLAGGRKRKPKLNPDGEEFMRPKKKVRGGVA